MNRIPVTQNLEDSLQRLAAQRHLYSKAKQLLLLHALLSVPAVIIWSYIAANSANMIAFAAFWGISITILDLTFFTPRIRKLQESAARIQEEFDCRVLELEWHNLAAGRPPSEEFIAEQSAGLRKKDPQLNELRDWYPVDVGKVPLPLGRIICQRTNCWWDSQLHKKYAERMILGVVLLSIFLFLISLSLGFSLENLVLIVLAPITPAITFGLRQFDKHQQASKTLSRLQDYTENLWELATSTAANSTELTILSRDLQDEILHHREQSPLVLDFFYGRLKQSHERLVQIGTKKLVDEALLSGNNGNLN